MGNARLDSGMRGGNRRGCLFVEGLLLCAALLLLPPPARAGNQAVRFSLPDNGDEKTISQGESFEVQLGTRAGTGYLWEIAGIDTDYLEIVDERTSNDPDPGRLGGPIINVWTLRARTPGLTEIRLVCRRPWEGNDAAADTFSLKLRILPK